MSKILNLAKLAKRINNPTLFINGNFDIWQRGVSFSKPGYTADRWFFNSYTFDAVDKDNRDGCIVKKVLSGGSIDNNSYAIELENLVSGYYYSLSQPIISELILPHQGETATVSYYARSPDGSFSTNLSGCFYYTPYVNDVISGRQTIIGSTYNHTINTNWTKYSYSFIIPSNAQSLLFEIIPFNTNLNANSKLQFTQAKLEIGSETSPLISESYLEQLKECESYYQIITHASPIPNNATQFNVSIPVRNKLKLLNNSRIIKNENNSQNILSSTFNIGSIDHILCAGRSSTSNSNINTVLYIESDIIPAGPPGVPTNITSLNNVVSGALVVSWSGAANNGSYINYYTINYGTTTNLNESIIIDVNGSHASGTPTSGVISGLLENQRYYFAIQTFNGFGSSITNTLSHFFDEYPVPSAINNLTGIYIEDVSASLNWSNVAGSPVPNKYIVQRDTVSTFNSTNLTTNIIQNTTNSHLNNYIFNGQIANYTGINAYYRITPIAGPETGLPTTVFLPRSSPSQPRNITTTSLVNAVTLNWIRPQFSNGSMITGYAIQYSTNSGAINSSSPVRISAQGANNTTTISSLQADTPVFFRIAAINSRGSGLWSEITTETPNRIPGTASSPRNLNLLWRSYHSFLNNDWTQSSEPSDYVVAVPYRQPNTTNDYAWPVSIAYIDWDPPSDNGGQNVSYYNLMLDTNPNYSSSNFKSYNTYSWQQTSSLMINNMISSSTGTWYVKCAAVNPSGTGTYTSGTLTTDKPKALLLSNSGNNNIYNRFEFVLRSGNIIDFKQNYYVNSCGLPLLSGYALTGTNSVVPSLKTSNNIFPRSSTDSQPFDIIISGLPQNTEFRYQPIWFNAAGSGSLNRPSGTLVWDSGRTPVVPAEAFKGSAFELVDLQGRWSNSFTVTLSQSKAWSSSMGIPSISGIYYSGTPSGGIPISTGIALINLQNTQTAASRTILPTVNLNYTPGVVWLRVYTLLNVTGTIYSSIPQDIELWTEVKIPNQPTLAVTGSDPSGFISVVKTVYTSGSLGDSLSNFSGSIYAIGYESTASSVNNSGNNTLYANNLLGNNYIGGNYNLVYKVSNSKYSISSQPVPVAIKSMQKTNFAFHAGTLILDICPYGAGYGNITFDRSWLGSTSLWVNNFDPFFGTNNFIYKNTLMTNSVKNYIRWNECGGGTICLVSNNIEKTIAKVPQHYYGQQYQNYIGYIYTSDISNFDLSNAFVRIKLGSSTIVDSSIKIQPLTAWTFNSSKFNKNIPAYSLLSRFNGIDYNIGYGFIY